MTKSGRGIRSDMMKNLDKILKAHQKWLAGDGGERANLSWADLHGADLHGANGNMVEVKSMFLETWPIAYTSEYLQIGCERHAITDWWGFDDDRISAMNSHALEWWRKWKDTIKSIVEMSPATGGGKVEEKGDG